MEGTKSVVVLMSSLGGGGTGGTRVAVVTLGAAMADALAIFNASPEHSQSIVMP